MSHPNAHKNRLRKIALNALYFSGVQRLGKRWTQGVGSILMLHHVREEAFGPFAPNRHLTISPDFLDTLLAGLAGRDLVFVSLDEAVRRLRHPETDKPFVAVTLDDGYRDNKEIAAPIFRKHNVPYTIYVAPGLIDGKADLWWEDLESIVASSDTLQFDFGTGRSKIDTASADSKNRAYADLMRFLTDRVDERRQREIVRELATVHKVDVDSHRAAQMMNWDEVIELNSDPLCTIGAHTIHHPMLARLSEEEAKFEMLESSRILADRLGERPKHFAYPYGMRDAAGAREFALAAELGFASAVTTRHGVIRPKHKNHLTALPRISINGEFQSQRYVQTLLSGLPTLLENKGKYLDVT